MVLRQNGMTVYTLYLFFRMGQRYVSMMVLVHLLPPSTQGRKRPGKLSARQANWDQHSGASDSIMESRQPYLLAVGTQRSVIHKYFIVIDKHAIP
ncbi:hypothetical protein F7725_019404, partial [Dissostichus mawsoni]